MRPVWFVLWAITIWHVAAWTFGPDKPEEKPSAGDGKPYGDSEKYSVDSRVSTRKNVMETLDLPWSSRCGENRKHFIAGVNYYYYRRQTDAELYPKYHGQLGADYIAKQWSTGEDQRIDRLTQEAYARGYFKLTDFDGAARKMIEVVVKDERVTGKGCAA